MYRNYAIFSDLDIFSMPFMRFKHITPFNAELHPICHLLALLGDRLIFHVSRIRVKVEYSAGPVAARSKASGLRPLAC